MDDIDVRIVKLQDLLDSPTRKNYVFSIYYDNKKLKDPTERANLQAIFTKHYIAKGMAPEQAEESAANTLRRIMEESADDQKMLVLLVLLVILSICVNVKQTSMNT